MARPRVTTALVVASAITHLGAYRVSTWGRGPSLLRAISMFQAWSRRTCGMLGVDVHLIGAPPAEPAVYIANHRSYLDVPVLSSVLPATFLSNDDVASWPIVGAAARELGVIFVDRSAMQARIRAARQIARRIRETSVIVFPEGTTGDDMLPRPFHAGLFRLLQRLAIRAVPVTLRYSSREAYWIEDIGVGEHLQRHVLGNRRLRVDVHLGAPIAPRPNADADDFAARVYAAVCAPIHSDGELAIVS